MTTATKKGALGNATMGANRNRLEIEDEHFFADPGIIADGQFPRKMNFHLRLNDHPSTDTRAE
jgi:hypothetical protein